MIILYYNISVVIESNNMTYRIQYVTQYILHIKANSLYAYDLTVLPMLTEHTYLEPCPGLLLCICFLQLWVMTLLRLILSSFPSLSLPLHLLLFLCEKNVMRKKEDFWHSSVKIFTQLLSAECVNEPRQRTATKDEERRRRSEEGRRMTDIPVRHCAASLRGSSKWDHHQPQQQLPHLMPFLLLLLRLLLLFFFCGSLNYL